MLYLHHFPEGVIPSKNFTFTYLTVHNHWVWEGNIKCNNFLTAFVAFLLCNIRKFLSNLHTTTTTTTTTTITATTK